MEKCEPFKNEIKKYNSKKFELEKIPLFKDNIFKIKVSKKSLNIDKKIESEESLITNLFTEKFGPNFFKEYSFLDDLKAIFGKNILNISHINPAKKDDNMLKDIINKKKKKKNVKRKLSTRINMGSMTYLNLRENLVSNKSILNDKLFYLSKNFEISRKQKDIVKDYIKQNKKNLTLYNNKISNSSKNSKINSKDEKENEFIKIENNEEDTIINRDRNYKIKKLLAIKNKNQSLSQHKIKIPKKLIKFKKTLIINRNNENINLDTLSSNNHRNFETEKKNDEPIKSNPLLLYKSNISNKYKNASNFSNSETNFYNQQISNFVIPKINDETHESEQSKLRTFYMKNNMSDAEINNIINNNFKSLSTNETNRELNYPRRIYNKYNSLNNTSSNFFPKKFKTKFYNDTKLLNNFINKCNKNLVKIINSNLTKKIEIDKVKIMKKKDNDKLVRALTEKNLSNKVLKKINKQNRTIKSVLKMSQNDDRKLSTNENIEEKFFLQNYKNMKDDTALFFIGKLFNTKNIRFHLNDIKKQRNEKNKKIQKDKILRIKRKLNTNNYLIQKFKFNLMLKNSQNSTCDEI